MTARKHSQFSTRIKHITVFIGVISTTPEPCDFGEVTKGRVCPWRSSGSSCYLGFRFIWGVFHAAFEEICLVFLLALVIFYIFSYSSGSQIQSMGAGETFFFFFSLLVGAWRRISVFIFLPRWLRALHVLWGSVMGGIILIPKTKWAISFFFSIA